MAMQGFRRNSQCTAERRECVGSNSFAGHLFLGGVLESAHMGQVAGSMDKSPRESWIFVFVFPARTQLE